MEKFSEYLERIGEFGVVTFAHHPIVLVDGLPSAKRHELIVFETGQTGEIFSIGKDYMEVLVFSQESVRVGTRVARTDEGLTVPVGYELLGFTIDPLGVPFSSKNSFKIPEEKRSLEGEVLGITARSKIMVPFRTGITIVDFLIPLGKGQKELIIGDRQTGKTAFALAALRTQVEEGSVGIYAAIAKKKSDIKRLEEFFQKAGILDKVIIVATSPYDSPSLIYLTAYTAMTIAEYFRDCGKDAVLVLDDLSTHAKFYREISLLAKRFPGRDSYPGDIFHTHARLLERAGNFLGTKDKKDVSITCLPLVEIIEGDFTGYIPTNLMSMTDGHIYFDSQTYYKGRRPAVHIGLSVTRVGHQTQSALKRDLNRELTVFLASYERMQNLSHFGAELSDTVKQNLKLGDKVFNFFHQDQGRRPTSEEIQLILFSMLWLQLFEEREENNLEEIRERLTNASADKKVQDLLKTTTNAKSFRDLLENVSRAREDLIYLVRKGSLPQLDKEAKRTKNVQ